MRIDADSHVPINEQIVQKLQSAIASGIYRTGEMLPSQRALALKLHVNPNTVSKAYAHLERMGIVVSRRGRGMFVARHGFERASRASIQRLRDQFTQAIRNAMPELDAGTMEVVFHEAMVAASKSSRRV